MRISKLSTTKSFILPVLVLLALLLFTGPSQAQANNVWYASYWNNMELSGTPAVQRVENMAPNVGWGFGSPVEGIQADQFSARWTTDQYFDPGQYRFSVRTDDGARLWVNKQLIVDEWHDSDGKTYTADVDFITAGPIQIRLDFYEDRGNAGIHLTWERKGNVASTGQIKAEYFNNPALQGTPILIRNEGPGLYHNWGNGSPDPSIYSDHFSARYTQAVYLTPGWYRFTSNADDGIRFWINNQLVIDRWYYSSEPATAAIYLPGGIQNFLVYYYEDVGPASVMLSMTKIEGEKESLPLGKLPPASTSGAVNTTALYMRSGPGTEFSPIGTLYKDDVITLTGEHEGQWVQVRTQDSFSGWVAAQYLDYNIEDEDPPPPEPPEQDADDELQDGDSSSNSPPKIKAFTITPPSVQSTRCVQISWRVEGDVDSVVITRNNIVIWNGTDLIGSTSDCPSTPGFAIYVIEASGPLGTVRLQNCCKVSVGSSE